MTDFKWLNEKFEEDHYMMMYVVRYTPTGKPSLIKEVVFWSCDELDNGEKIGMNIINVYKAFEELARKWESYENYLAIENIECKKVK